MFSSSSLQAMCVKSKTAVIRSEANKSAKELITLNQYTPVKWSGQKKNGYFEVSEKSGIKGWVKVSDVSVSLICLQIKTNRIVLRSGPGNEFDKINTQIKKGDTFLDLGGEDGWTQIQNQKGETGWVQIDKTWKPTSTTRLSFENE